MATGAPAFGTFGRPRMVRIRDLRAGHMLLEHIHGHRGKIIVAMGEVLSQKHVDQLIKLCDRPGPGSLLLYNHREVWARVSRASGDERPRCETDAEQCVSLQKWYRRLK